MLDIIEKNNSVILVFEEPTYEERLLIDRARMLKSNENRMEQKQEVVPQQNGFTGGIDWSRFKCNSNRISQIVYVRVRAWSSQGDMIFDDEDLDRNGMLQIADNMRRDGYSVEVTESPVPTKAQDSPMTKDKFMNDKPENYDFDNLYYGEEVLSDGGVPF